MFINLTLSALIARIFVLVSALTVHEFAHAWTADKFGDMTPRLTKRLTLNPLAHLDPLGSLMLLVAGFGWAKPVQVNPYTLARHSAAALALVSLAGPLANFLMAVLAAIPFRLGFLSTYEVATSRSMLLPSLATLLYEVIFINLILMLFNLIPLAPLDGDKIAEYFFPSSWKPVLERIRPYGPAILLLLVFGGRVIGLDFLGFILGQPTRALLQLLLG